MRVRFGPHRADKCMRDPPVPVIRCTITLCRSLNIPARYVFGYLPDIGVPDPGTPMDFCAWMEVYLGDGWHTFDPRNNERRIGRTVIGRGRDAADVAMVTSFGEVQLLGMTVVAAQRSPLS